MRIVCMVSPRRLGPTMVGLTLTMCVLVHGELSGLCVTLTIESAPSSGHAGGCMPRHAARRHARDDFKGLATPTPLPVPRFGASGQATIVVVGQTTEQPVPAAPTAPTGPAPPDSPVPPCRWS